MNRQQQLGLPTKPEIVGYQMLDSLNIVYHRQHLIAHKFCVDAFVPSLNLIIQFDGDYWHGNPRKFPNLDTRQLKRKRLDTSQDAYMKKCGYTVLRVWESDLMKRPDTIIAQFREIVTPALPSPILQE